MNKYKNSKTIVDGHKFDSQKEARYYGTLKMRKLAGEIKDFTLQETYLLDVNNVRIGKYIADFKIIHLNGLFEVVDVKGFKTPIYNIKKKLMKAIHGIEIKEI
jgi:hypothetical protein